MSFAIALNDYAFLFIVLLAVTIFIGLWIGAANGGWNRNLPYMWSLVIFLIYLLITPVFFYANDRKTIIGTDISKYYGAGFFFDFIAVLCFILGYWIKGRSEGGVWLLPSLREIKDPVKKISILFYVLYGIVLTNLAAGGANISDVFFGNAVVGLGAEGASYYFQNFSDSLIAVLVLAYLIDVPRKQLIIWIIASFFLFSILGFRYRIILSLTGLLFVYLYKNKLNAAVLIWSLVLGLLFFYFTLFSTLNRQKLIFKDYNSLIYDPMKFEYDQFFEQTRGALPDMAVYKLYDNPNRNVNYDYGRTMFGYILIRILPRSILTNKDDFYPPPQLAISIQAYDAYYARFTGEATLSIGAFYIAGGWLGIVLGCFIWGLLLRMLGNKIRLGDKLSIIGWIIVSLASFQWITRGYFPQVVDHFAYLMVPIWIMRYLAKHSKNETD